MKLPIFAPVVIAGLVAFGLSFPDTTSAQGKITRRPVPERPATSSNGCLVTPLEVSSGMFRIERRAKRDARANWEKSAKRLYGADFAHWDLANPYVKKLTCERTGRRNRKFLCVAVAQACDGSGYWLYKK